MSFVASSVVSRRAAMLSKLLALGLVLSTSAGPAGAAAIPPAPIGLDVNGTEFALVSNGTAWKVSTNGTTFGPVRVVSVIAGANRNAPGALQRQVSAFIWAPTCVASRQTLTFKRTYFLLGRSKTIGASLTDTTFQGGAANLAISSAKIYINGKLAFSAPGASIRVPKAARSMATFFKPGENLVEIVVVKRALQGANGKCVNGSKPLGVQFYISGDYESDLWLSNTASVQDFWVRASAGATGVPIVVGGSPINKGPSTAYKGVMQVQVAGPGMTVGTTPAVSGAGLRNCLVTTTVGTGKMVCEVYQFPANQSARATFRVLVALPETFDVVVVTSAASINSPTNDPIYNNSWIRWHHICSATSTNPNCPP